MDDRSPGTTPEGLNFLSSMKITEVRQSPQIDSLDNPHAIQQTVDILTRGGIVAAQVRGIFGIFMDAYNPQAVALAFAVKGETTTKTVSAMMPTEELLPLVDKNRIAPHIQILFANYHGLREKVGALCFIRVPLQEAQIALLPPTVIGKDAEGKSTIHNLDPHEHPIRLLHDAMKQKGMYLAATSLNFVGQPEITTKEGAIQLLHKTGNISLLLTDPSPYHPDIVGSFAIVDLGSGKSVRDGHVPVRIIERILGVSLDHSEVQPAKYPHAAHFLRLLESDLHSNELLPIVRGLLRGEEPQILLAGHAIEPA